MSICQHFVYVKMSTYQHFVYYEMSVNQHFVVVFRRKLRLFNTFFD